VQALPQERVLAEHPQSEALAARQQKHLAQTARQEVRHLAAAGRHLMVVQAAQAQEVR